MWAFRVIDSERNVFKVPPWGPLSHTKHPLSLPGQVYALLWLIAVGSGTHVFQMIDKLLIVPTGKEASSKMYLRENVFLDTVSKKRKCVSCEPVVFTELLDLLWGHLFIRGGIVACL